MEIEETVDPQYAAVSALCELHGPETAFRLAVANAAISYRLLGKGEEHWMYFSRYFSRPLGDVCSELERYVMASPYLRLAREARLRRVRKLCGIRLSDVLSLWVMVAERLAADRNSKTVVFSAKMGGYALRACGIWRSPFPMEIPIPVDYRVARLSVRLGLFRGAADEALRRYADVQNAWRQVALESAVPPLHIDTLIWLAGRMVLHGDAEYSLPRSLLELLSD